MAIVKTWEVNTMEHFLSDGYVNKVIYRVKAIDDSTAVEAPNTRQTGEVTLEIPQTLPPDFIPYEDLTAAVCISWVKEALGNDGVAAVEAAIDAALAPPTTATGKPFD